MAGVTVPFRFCHTAGHCECAFVKNGQRLLTAGSDSVVRVWNSLSPDEEPSQFNHEPAHELTGLAVSPMNGVYATATDTDHGVRLWELSSHSLRALLTRLTARVRHIVYDRTESLLAVVGDAPDIKVVVTPNEETRETVFVGGHDHSAVYSAAFCSDSLATAGCDSSVRIWNVRTRQQLRKLNTARITNDTVHRIDWEEQNRLLAIPKGGCVQLYSPDKWNVSLELSSLPSACHVVHFAPGGMYLVAAYLDRSIASWDLRKPSCPLKRFVHSASLTCVAWNPARDCLAMVDSEGNLGLWEDALGAAASMDTAQQAMISKDDKAETTPAEGDHPTLEEQQDNDVEEMEPEEYPVAKKIKLGDDTLVHQPYPPIPLQPAFQPGATPVFGEEDGGGKDRRFLAWNLIGVITTRDEHTYSSVEVEFHDATRSRNIRLTDHYNFQLAALGEHATFFASKGDDQSPSSLYFRPFDAWASNSDWTFQLPKGEEAQVVALGRKWAAVGTSHRLLRIFTYTGLQLLPISLPGPIVTLASTETELTIVYHGVSPFSGEQSMHYERLDIESRSLRDKGALPLSKEATLSWFGYTDWGVPAAFDSQGILRILSPDFGGQWTPVFSTERVRKNRQESFWVIGVTSESLVCVVCKGKEPPAVLPRPVVSDYPLSISLCQGDVCNAELEEKFLLTGLKSDDGTDTENRAVEADQAVLQLLQASCQEDRNARALDLCTHLHFLKSLDIAVAVATKLHLPRLAERIDIVRQARSLGEQEQEEPGEQGEQDSQQQSSDLPVDEESFIVEEEDPAMTQGPPAPRTPSKKKPSNPFAKKSGTPSKAQPSESVFRSLDRGDDQGSVLKKKRK